MSIAMRDYSEKRDFRRMEMNVEIEIKDISGAAFTGICRNLSGTGMQILSDRKLSEGDQVQVSVPSNHQRLSGLEAECRVVRCQPESEGYLIGAEVVQITA